MKKAYRQETLEALVSDSRLREARAVLVEVGWSLQARLGVSWRPVRSRRGQSGSGQASRGWSASAPGSESRP